MRMLALRNNQNMLLTRLNLLTSLMPQTSLAMLIKPVLASLMVLTLIKNQEALLSHNPTPIEALIPNAEFSSRHLLHGIIDPLFGFQAVLLLHLHLPAGNPGVTGPDQGEKPPNLHLGGPQVANLLLLI